MFLDTVEDNNKEDVWFVYDGECPICKNVSKAYRMKKALGNLRVLNARKEKNHPILKEINSLGLNLDDGMVIKFRNTHYHGSDALHVMALIGTNHGLFNYFNSVIFRSKFLSQICYPFLRLMRNLFLLFKGVKRIDNLKI